MNDQSAVLFKRMLFSAALDLVLTTSGTALAQDTNDENELAIKDTRWSRLPARRRPYYGPVHRMRVLKWPSRVSRTPRLRW